MKPDVEIAGAIRHCLDYLKKDALEQGLSPCVPHIERAIAVLDLLIEGAEIPPAETN